jgi:ligand-binding sensor domain-containing protein
MFLLTVALVTYAQDPHPTFRHYTVENGLPSSEIYQIKQDSKGYIWFAIGNGVSRFDGYEFEDMSMADGLPDNTVFEIFEGLSVLLILLMARQELLTESFIAIEVQKEKTYLEYVITHHGIGQVKYNENKKGKF